ncbi:hypothetical protein [Pseudonocardia sp.]|uniref:hypothetical protein n=2 Tax=Pseudonocardia sp. TaxID=60912 RepID=UPI003D1490C5
MTGLEAMPGIVLTTSVHVYPSTSLSHRLYRAEGRATVRIGSRDTDVTLYANRNDLARLRDLLDNALTQLDAASGPTAA